MSPIHPNLLEEIYYDKFLPIYFKCWCWLKAIVMYNPVLRDRGAPPYREGNYCGEVDEPLWEPRDIHFRFPWCQDWHLQKKSIYYVDYLYEETFCNPVFKVVDAGREFPSVAIEVRADWVKYNDLRRELWGFITPVDRPDGEVFEQYYWDSFWKSNTNLLCGPLSLCDHDSNSPFKFTDRIADARSPKVEIAIPSYQGNSFATDWAACKVSQSQQMWTHPVPGVKLWTNSHSINERLKAGYKVKIQYLGDRSMPSFVHPDNRLVCNWDDPRYFGDTTCQSPDVYKYI